MKRYKVDLVYHLWDHIIRVYQILLEFDEEDIRMRHRDDIYFDDDWLNKTKETINENITYISPHRINEYTKDQWLELVRCIEKVADVSFYCGYYADPPLRYVYSEAMERASSFLGFALKYIPKPYELDKETDNET